MPVHADGEDFAAGASVQADGTSQMMAARAGAAGESNDSEFAVEQVLAAAPAAVVNQDVHAVANQPLQRAGRDNQDDCVICWASEQNTVCIPCGHIAMCKDCSGAVLKKSGLCPVCRADVHQVYQVYRV